MKYIDLINNYWKLREQGLITSQEGDLYLYLIHVCNGLMWKNPFNLPSSSACSALGINRRTLSDRRKRLRSLELIEFFEGTTNVKPPIYVIMPVSKSASKVPVSNSAALAMPLMDADAEDTIENEETVPEPVIERKHEVMPVFYTYKDIGQIAMNDIAMHQGIPMNIINECLVQFGKDRECDKQTYKTPADLLKHFTSLCKIAAKKVQDDKPKIVYKTGKKG